MLPLALPPALADFTLDHFSLGDELQCLWRVQQAGAVEAEVFYAARILEVLSAEALRAVRLPATSNTFANLDVLQQLNLLPRTTCYWAHALRRTGNAARHIQRRIVSDDAELALLFLERWLGWFFAEYRHGPRRGDLPAETLCLGAHCDPNLRTLMRTLEQGAFGHESLLTSDSPFRDAVRRSPTLPAVGCEMLLERGKPAEARAVALAAQERFPEDLRLRQLIGLSYSRQGDLEQARAWLEPLFERHRDDEETLGITAGLFKRLADARPGANDWLKRAHRAYLQGWERSRYTNAYLGINASTTALFLGLAAVSQEQAAFVRDLLVRRLGLLGGEPATASRDLGYWDSVTLAEAHLLLGDFPAARASYREAFTRHHDLAGNLEVTRRQLGRLLGALGIGEDVDAFLGKEHIVVSFPHEESHP